MLPTAVMPRKLSGARSIAPRVLRDPPNHPIRNTAGRAQVKGTFIVFCEYYCNPGLPQARSVSTSSPRLRLDRNRELDGALQAFGKIS